MELVHIGDEEVEPARDAKVVQGADQAQLRLVLGEACRKLGRRSAGVRDSTGLSSISS